MSVDKLQNVEGRGLFLLEMTQCHGWTILMKEANEKVASLEDRIQLSNDPQEVFACVKEKNGILFLIATANDFVDRGEKATKSLQQLSK